MQRILLLVFVLYLVWRVASAFGRRIKRDSPGVDDFSRFSAKRRDHRRRMKEARTNTEEELVECAGCSTYVPASKALADGDGRLFCDRSCRAKLNVGAG